MEILKRFQWDLMRSLLKFSWENHNEIMSRFSIENLNYIIPIVSSESFYEIIPRFSRTSDFYQVYLDLFGSKTNKVNANYPNYKYYPDFSCYSNFLSLRTYWDFEILRTYWDINQTLLRFSWDFFEISK